MKLRPHAARPKRFTSVTSIILAFIVAATLAGCGGGNGAPANVTTPGGGTGGSTTLTTVAKSVQLLASAPTMPSAGSAPIDLTAIVLDANNIAVGGKTVSFIVTDISTQPAFVNNISASGVTDPNGLVTAKLNLGADKTNRNIVVTITAVEASGTTGATGAVTIAVAGTAITISGPNSMVLGSSLALTAQVKDSAGTLIPGKSLTISSVKGNAITPAIAVTDQNGQIKFTVSGGIAGSDTISVTGVGATQTLAITVNGSNFAFAAPATNTEVVINTNQVITVHWDTSGVPQVGQPILFSATRGTLSAATVNTDVNGNASVSITSPGTGIASLTATGPGGSPAAALTIIFTTTTANKVSIQAAQSTVPFNLVGQTTNFTALTAIVRDVNNNLVKGARVNFQIVNDPSGGQLSSPSAITDISGVATVNYIAGNTSSGNNTVQVSSTVVDVNGVAVIGVVTASVFMTVRNQSLFIRMATDNLLASGTGTYTKTYYALVTDAASNPVTGTTVVFTLKPGNNMEQLAATICAGLTCPGAYQKGQYYLCASATVGPVGTPPGCPGIGWFKLPLQPSNYYTCLNEDVNFNGILDAGEDFNSNGKLDPGNVAGVNPTDVTDAQGFAKANVSYAKDFATWASVIVTATITVAGTEFTQSIEFDLPAATADYTNTSQVPPGRLSPFGYINPCNIKG